MEEPEVERGGVERGEGVAFAGVPAGEGGTVTKYLSYLSAQGMGFVTWAGELSHAEMAAALTATTVRSAGFIQLLPTGRLQCAGQSVSLDIPALPQDSALANRIFQIE